MNEPEQYAYRIAAFLSPGATVVGLATFAASDGGSAITGPEWVMAVVATITAAAAQGAVRGLPDSQPGFRANKRPSATTRPR